MYSFLTLTSSYEDLIMSNGHEAFTFVFVNIVRIPRMYAAF
jgi:hypothetical protein